MRVLGIDPGTVVLGYGVVDEDGGRITLVACGAVSLSSKTPIEERLCRLYNKLGEIIASHKPEVVAVEEPFVHENVRTALAIGRAEAVALVAAGSYKVPVYRYSPAQVKQRVTSFGGSDKRQVQQTIRLLLNLKAPPEPSDAADALAVAVCHLKEAQLQRLLQRQGITALAALIARQKRPARPKLKPWRPGQEG